MTSNVRYVLYIKSKGNGRRCDNDEGESVTRTFGCPLSPRDPACALHT